MKLLLFQIGWLFALVMAIERPNYDLSKAQQYFDNFIQTYSKDYAKNGQEKQKRFKIFKENLKVINHLNSFNESFYGVTKFSDLTAQEFQDQYCHNSFPDDDEDRRPKCPIVTDPDIVGVNIPASLDYRDRHVVTSVKDQGRCNSCWAFSTVGTLEGAYAIKHKKLLTFAPKQLLDCLQCSTECSGNGSSMRKALAELWGAGVMLDADYPYAPEKTRCNYNPAKAKVHVTGCTNFVLTNEGKYKDVLVQHGPMSMGINATLLQHYTGGILTAQMCPPAKVNHAVLLVGYGSDSRKDYWLIKDSRGVDFGEAGYIRMEQGHNVCGLLNRQAVVGSVE